MIQIVRNPRVETNRVRKMSEELKCKPSVKKVGQAKMIHPVQKSVKQSDRKPVAINPRCSSSSKAAALASSVPRAVEIIGDMDPAVFNEVSYKYLACFFFSYY